MSSRARDAADVRGIQSVEVGIRIIEPFLTTTEPLKLREIAEGAGVAPAQAHAYLVSFRRLGLVEQDETTARYRLGPLALQLAIARMHSFDPMKSAAEAVEQLRADTGLTIAASVWGSFGPTVVMLRDGVEQVYINTKVGTVYSVTGTATGLVFAAYKPEATIRAFVRSELREGGKTLRVGKTRTYQDALEDIALVRTRGYATIDPKPVPGIGAVAAPVLDYSGQIQMVVTLIGTERNRDLEPGGPVVERLLACAERLSLEHGRISS